jgi:hypothetical protein
MCHVGLNYLWELTWELYEQELQIWTRIWSSHSSAYIPEDIKQIKKQTLWPESSSELYWPSDRRLLAKLLPTFADKGVSRSPRRIPTAVISVF